MMRKKLLLLAFSLLGFLYAVEERPQAKKDHDQIFDQQENFFQTSTPYKITPKVNPITGDLIEEEIDLVVASSEPLSLRRFYNHSAIYEHRTGGWHYNPETFFVANFELPTQMIFSALGDVTGNIVPLKPSANECRFNFSQGFSHIEPNGQTHPLNIKVIYHKAPGKEKGLFSWAGEILDGSGTKRFFYSGEHCWLSNLITDVRRSSISGTIYVTMYKPSCWTPYQLQIHEEKKPNGNIICYTYTKWKTSKFYPRPALLSGIKAYNADKSKELGSIAFHYNKNKEGDVQSVIITGSDGRNVTIKHQNKSPFPLSSVKAPGKPPVNYDHEGYWINCVKKPDDRLIATKYDANGKVASQHAPVGPNSEMHSIGRYVYHENDTEAYDAEDNKMIYRFNEYKQLLSIETYKNEKIYRINRLVWDAVTGNLLKKTVEDGSGNVFQIAEYAYDKNHNLILEKMGDGKDWRTISRTFSEDGFNLKLSESDREGKQIQYTYVPGTNLLVSELVYEEQAIRARTFHMYDNCAIRIKTIIDDGSSKDLNNLQDVTYRKVTQITPKQTSPCFGLPEIVEEKTIDSNGKEILLHKVIYTYTRFGKILKEEHYDSNGSYRYSIHNTYDENERLSSQTDPLNNTKTFDYDANHNLITVIGPKSDQYREITYDKANRPIRIADWQTDGSILITEKKYDKLGRLIEETNPCGNKIKFQYDELSRLVAIVHPDGAIEGKEYDLFDNVTKETDPDGYEIQKTYNCFGQVLDIVYPDGSTEHFSYNPTATLATHREKNGAISCYFYDVIHDSRGREAKRIKLNQDNQILQQYENIYSKSGNKVAVVHTIFSNAKPIKTITHRWEYGPMGRIERFFEAEARETRYIYDGKGRIITLTKPDGRSLSHEYDDLGRLTRFSSKEFDYRYTYDFNDRVTAIHDKISKTSTYRSYDLVGNILEETLANGLSFQNGYDNIGRRSSLKLPDSSRIGYTYDGHYLYQINRNGYNHTHSERNLEGKIIEAILPDSQKVFIERDKLGRFTSYRSPYYSACYPKEAYDGNGNLLYYQDSRGEYKFTYDSLDQLVSENDHTYLFDSLYNRLKKDDLDYIIDPFCQVSCEGKLNYEYDACGNLISDVKNKYYYDTLNRLIAVQLLNQRLEYTYDPFNRRFSKTIFSKGSKIAQSHYMWDGDNEIGTVNEKNHILELRVLGEGLGAEIGAAVLYELRDKSYIPIHDHRGCVVVLVDLETKKPIESYDYTAFGEELTQNTLSPWRFSSKRVDDETKLIFFGRRYYHPSLGRFITQDPEGFADGPNLYSYLKNCPMADFDLDREWSSYYFLI